MNKCTVPGIGRRVGNAPAGPSPKGAILHDNMVYATVTTGILYDILYETGVYTYFIHSIEYHSLVAWHSILPMIFMISSWYIIPQHVCYIM